MALTAALIPNNLGPASGDAIIFKAWNALMHCLGASGTALMGPPPHNQASNIVVVNAEGTQQHRSILAGYRLDRQNAAAGNANLSIQINGIGAPSTIASVMIPTHYYQGVIQAQPASVAFRDRELVAVIRQGFTKSLNSRALAQGGARNGWQIGRAAIGGAFSN